MELIGGEISGGGGSVVGLQRREVQIEGQRRLAAERRGEDAVLIVVDHGGRGVAIAVAIIECDRVHGPTVDRRETGVGNPRSAEGLDGAAHAAAGGPARLDRIKLGKPKIRTGFGLRDRQGEVGLGLGPAEGAGRGVVGPGSGLGGVEGAEPDARFLPRISDLRREPAPWPLSDAAEPGLVRGLVRV